MKKWIIFAFTILCLSSCMSHETDVRLEEIENHIYGNPDSTLMMLSDVDPSELNQENRALWSLLYTWTKYRDYAKVIDEDTLMIAFNQFSESKNPLRRAQVYYLRSVVHEDQQRGDPAEWVEDLYTGCKAVEQTSDYVLGAQLCQRYGAKLYKMHQYDEAVVWDQKYVDYSKKSNRIKDEVLANINLALSQLYGEIQHVTAEIGTSDGVEVANHTQFESAFATMYHALNLAKQNKLRTEEGKIYGNLAIFHSQCQHIDSLLFYALKAKDVDEEQYALGKRSDPVRYVHVSDAYRKIGNADSCIYYAMIDIKNPSMTTRRNACQQLYMAYRDLKHDYEQSLEWMSLFNRMSDSIHQRIETQQINTVQASVDHKIETEEVTSKSRSYMIWGIAGSLGIILAIVGWMMHNRRNYKKQLKKMEDEFNELLQKKKEMVAKREAEEAVRDAEKKAVQTPTATTSTAETKQPSTETEPAGATEKKPASLHLTGSTKEQLEVEPGRILYLTSESNYVKIVYQGTDNKLQHKMLRQTISNCEEMLQEFPQLVRCHRAFIVNLQHVTHASSVPNGLQLSFDATTLTVPVSRTYINIIKERLK